MSNFKLVIDFIFSLFVQIWNVINQHWILQVMLGILVIGIIIDLTVQTTPKQ